MWSFLLYGKWTTPGVVIRIWHAENVEIAIHILSPILLHPNVTNSVTKNTYGISNYSRARSFERVFQSNFLRYPPSDTSGLLTPFLCLKYKSHANDPRRNQYPYGHIFMNERTRAGRPRRTEIWGRQAAWKFKGTATADKKGCVVIDNFRKTGQAGEGSDHEYDGPGADSKIDISEGPKAKFAFSCTGTVLRPLIILDITAFRPLKLW